MRRLSRFSAALAVGLVLAGCASLPTSGPVEAGPEQTANGAEAPFDFNPTGPVPGDDPEAVVSGFLTALQATPVSTTVAKEFLTETAAAEWVPEQSTVMYGAETATGVPGGVRVSLQGTAQLDDRGRWLGDPTGGQGISLDLRLVKEQGEWRIANPPDAMVVPQSHFESRFQQYNLYFFDPSAQVLVPEPVFLPWGVQAPTLLVEGLLAGPAEGLRRVERSLIPPNTRLDISVPVSASGLAQVPLSDEFLELDAGTRDLALAQLARTLSQVPGVERLQVSVDGTPLDLPGAGAEVGVGGWSEFDPALTWASSGLFAIRGGAVVELVGDQEQEVVAAQAGAAGIRAIGVDVTGQEVAAVDDGGADVHGLVRDATPGAAEPVLLYSGQDVLRPAFDLLGQVWLVDRTTSGARLVVVADDRPVEVAAPGLSGTDVRSFAVSRDGTRLAAVVRGELGSGQDELVVARIVRDGDGSPVRLTPARPVPAGLTPTGRIRDLGWATPTALALLTVPASGVSQLILASVDGSSVLDDTGVGIEPRFDASRSLATWPGEGAPLYVLSRDREVLQLLPSGRWGATGIAPGLAAPTFVG